MTMNTNVMRIFMEIDMDMVLMFAGIFMVMFSIWVQGTNIVDCKTLWDVHQKYMKYVITIGSLIIGLVAYFVGLALRVG